MHNASSVIEVGTLKEKLHKLEHEHAQMTEEYAALSRMQIEYDNLIHDQQEKLSSSERRLEAMQRECFEKVDGATELAEKQNALTMTLEAKVCMLVVRALFVFSLLGDLSAQTSQVFYLQFHLPHFYFSDAYCRSRSSTATGSYALRS